MKTNTLPPYEVAQEPGGRPFLAFETAAGKFARPWHAMRDIRLSPDDSSLVFEYADYSVEVTGAGLGALFDLATASRLKTVRVGESDGVTVAHVRPVGLSED